MTQIKSFVSKPFSIVFILLANSFAVLPANAEKYIPELLNQCDSNKDGDLDFVEGICYDKAKNALLKKDISDASKEISDANKEISDANKEIESLKREENKLIQEIRNNIEQH